MNAKTRHETRSPLKRKPLRNAGQSVQEQLDDALDGEIGWIVLAPMLLTIYAVTEWSRFLAPQPPHPWIVTVLALTAIGFAYLRFRKVRTRAAALRLGRDGEKSVAQLLEVTRQPQWRIFNDIPGGSFNVDHLVIAPQGVFVLETKTVSKPVGNPDAKVKYDGNAVTVNGFTPDRDPVRQVAANRDWIRDTLKETTGRTVQARGVVLYPGWWVDQTSGGHPEVWVLNPKALPQFIAGQKTILSSEDIALLSDAIAYRITRE